MTYPIDAWRVLMQMQHGVTPTRAIKLPCHACGIASGIATTRCVLGWRICKRCADAAADLPAIEWRERYFQEYPAHVQRLSAGMVIPPLKLAATPISGSCTRCLAHGEYEYTSGEYLWCAACAVI